MYKLLASIFIIIISYITIKYDIGPAFGISYLKQTEQCFIDGQIPCRWLIDSNNGLGFPVFNYLSPLPYYISLIFRQFGFDYSVSLVLTITTISLFLFYFLNKLFPKKIFLVFTITILSLFTTAIFPLTLVVIFFSIFNKNLYLASLFFGLALISVDIQYFLYLLILTNLTLFLFYSQNLKKILSVTILALLLSSFYIGPSLTELFQNQPKLSETSLNYPQVIKGQAYLSQFQKRSNFWRLTAEVSSNEMAQAIIPISYHPTWTILIDQMKTIPTNDTLYQPTIINIPPGQHTIVAFLQNSTSTFIFNLLTLLTGLYLFVVSFPKNVKKDH
jgi:hypothetical protein